MRVQPPETHNHEKYDEEKAWYLRYDHDNIMTYKYPIVSLNLNGAVEYIQSHTMHTW